MTNAVFLALPCLAFSGALMLLLPQFAPRRYFFTITVPPGFPSTPEARAIERTYRWEFAAALAVCAALVLFLAPAMPDFTVPAGMLLPFCAGFLLFLLARSKVRRYADTHTGVREAELTATDNQLPRWTLWALLPLAAPLATAAYLERHWNEIPARFPSHWNLQGVVDGWSTRTAAGVYGNLAIAAGLMLLILLGGIGIFYGSRRAPQRMAVLKMLIGVMYLLAAIFTWIGLTPLVHLSVGWVFAAAGIFSLAVIAWSFKLLRDPAMPVDLTPDACWILGTIYYNRHDPAIFVQKRVGFGYTLNFGSTATWLILGGIAAGILGLNLLLKP